MPPESNLHNNNESLELTVLITVVGGEESIRENLAALVPQLDFAVSEVIIPYDKFSCGVRRLASEFPQARFHYITDLGLAESSSVTSHTHRLYDRRRAVGLQLARGTVVAMLEDHGVPAADWVEQMLAAQRLSNDVVGGAVQNGDDRPLNRAVYYCDFGRYGLPFRPRAADYVSDINVAYKRRALVATRHLWQDAYHETAVHGELLAAGKTIVLDDRPVVFQKRRGLTVSGVLKERVQWGRIYAETRAAEFSAGQRIYYSGGTILLPAVLLFRAVGHMRRQARTVGTIVETVPIMMMLLIAWSVGEFVGYASSPASIERSADGPIGCDANARV